MVTKKRSEGQTAISVSMDADLAQAMDQRAKALGLNRSQYIASLARRDLNTGGDFVLSEGRPGYQTPATPPPATPATPLETALHEELKAVKPVSYGKRKPRN